MEQTQHPTINLNSTAFKNKKTPSEKQNNSSLLAININHPLV